jgi:hypothetical protein
MAVSVNRHAGQLDDSAFDRVRAREVAPRPGKESEPWRKPDPDSRKRRREFVDGLEANRARARHISHRCGGIAFRRSPTCVGRRCGRGCDLESGAQRRARGIGGRHLMGGVSGACSDFAVGYGDFATAAEFVIDQKVKFAQRGVILTWRMADRACYGASRATV